MNRYKLKTRGHPYVKQLLTFLLSLIVLVATTPDLAKADAIEHTHIWATKYDDKNHWEYCTVCGAVQNKEPHTLVGNGQSMVHCTDKYSNAYRKVCKCGYQSKPFLIIHGRYENWRNSRVLNYNGISGMNVNSILQITKQEFDTYKSTLQTVGCMSETGLTWTDDDGDGYGWVFCGGIVMKSGTTKGTIELITGSEGDYGRKDPFDEVYILAAYVNSTDSPSRSGFVEYLNKRINSKGNPSNHLLYGYNTKYQNKVTDAQFAQLVKEFKGYNTGSSKPGWREMWIQNKAMTHEADGRICYGNFRCYDSSNGHNVNDKDGIKTDCDICNAHWTGNEGYESETWYRCGSCHNLSEGQIVKCSGHKIYGREYMGTIYDTFTKKNGQYYRTKVEAIPAAGYIATINCNKNQAVGWTYNYSGGKQYPYYGKVVFSNGKTGRSVMCGVYAPYIDEDSPVINTITMTPQTSSNGWATISQLDVSGTENYCDTVYLTITNKSSGKVMLDNAAIQVADKKYSYSTTPPLEGSEGGTVYTASVKDLYGNVSTKDFTVYKTDGTAPQVESKLSYTDWTSAAKTVTLTFTDYGSGSVQASLSDQAHYQACTKSSDGKYHVTYTFSDDIIGTKNYTVYVKDALGNATGYTLTIGNIDKNTYSISYNLNGGSISGQPTSYNVESSTFTLPQPTKAGYTFTGWTGSNGATPQMAVTVNKGTRENLSYTANWQVNMYINYIQHWTYGYRNREGTNSNKNAFPLKTTTFQSQYENAFVLDSARAVNIPNGFYLNFFGTAAIDNEWKSYPIGTKVTQKASNMTFEYDYDPVSYSITYNLNGGTNNNVNPSTYNVLYGVTLADPSKAGSSFNGWHENMINSNMLNQYKYNDEVIVNSNSVTFYTTLNDNKLNYCAFQIWKDDKLWDGNGGYNQFAEFSTPGARTSASYKHSLPSGKYYVRLKANGNKADRSIVMPLYLEQGKTYTMGYKVDSFTPEKVVISDIYFVSLDKVTGINEGCNATFSSADDLYAKLAERKTGNISLVALWKYDTVHVKVPQVLTGDSKGNSSFRVKCDDFKAGSIKVTVPDSFPYKQAGKADVTAAITVKSGNNIITPTNKVCVYNITTTNGLSAGCWQGSFNIGLTLTKE